VPNLIVSAVSTFDNKGLKKGRKEVSAFEKQVKSFGKTFGTVFAAASLVAFSKKAVKAFADDQAAAKRLEVQLKNTGFAFATPYVEGYIARLQNLTGVLDDNLRPAFQSLLTATQSVTLSQEALNVALDTSAAIGMSLQQVTDVLVRGYNGQTKGLKNLGVALSKNALKTGNMELALKELQKAYSGQAAARLTTYAGKIDLLKVAAADATEVIGKGLVDALTKLGKDDSIQNAADSMNSFALAIADTVRGLGLLVGEVKKFAGTDIGKLLAGLAFLVYGSKKLLIGGALALIAADIGRSNPVAQPNVGGYSGIPSVQERLKQQEIINRKKLIDALKAEEALKKLKDKYDIERINLTAALNAATDEETKTRIAEKLAILDGNAAMAEKYKLQNIENEVIKTVTDSLVILAGAAMDSADKFKKLNPFAGTLYGETGRDPMPVPNDLTTLLGLLGALSGGLSGLSNGKMAQVFPTLTPEFYSGQRDITNPLAGTYFGETGRDPMPVEIKVTVDAGGDRLSQAIAESIQVATRSGYSTVPAGFIA
jgi:hypothetical protein